MTLSRAKTTVHKAPARRGVPSSLPTCLGTWELGELVAQGTLTQVYRARPFGAAAEQSAAYALKTIRPDRANDLQAIAVLRREAMIGRTVAHPHLIPVLAFSTQASPFYVVMPWLSGSTLAARLEEQGRLEQGVALWLARQVAEALQALGEAGWMHGDVKPSNIFVSPEGHVTLLDLGFARRLRRPEPRIERVVSGTCNYMAPEAIGPGYPIDIRSDIYSLGAVLFEMLSGRLPFEGEEPAEVARMHREVRVPDLKKLVPELVPEAAVLVREMLSKQPLRRPQTPREVINRLVALEIATLPGRVSA